MKQYGLIGYPLSHSFSKKYFDGKFQILGLSDHRFANFEIADIQLISKLISDHPDLNGLSVTIPYKEKVIPYLDEIDSVAQEIGAVNAIRIIQSENKIILKGYNTDIYGFEESLRPLLKVHHKKALILGSGGASKAVAFACNKLGIKYMIVSRSGGELSYDDLDASTINTHQIIVNTTPLGMFPDVEKCPSIPYIHLSDKHIAFDLIYNPEKSLFLNNAEKQGAQIINGLDMLQFQADKAWEIWNS